MENKTSTEQVVKNYWEAFLKNDAQQISDLYADDAFIVTPIGKVRGKADITDYWKHNSLNLPNEFLNSVKVIANNAKNETAYLTYEAKPYISLVSNTWLIQNGKIVSHTMVSSEPMSFGQEYFNGQNAETPVAPNDELTQSSQALFYRYVQGFQKPDGEWLASHFAEDGFIITPMGTVTGRKEIADYLNYIFGNAPEEYLTIGSGITQYIEGQTAVAVYEKVPIVDMGSDTWHIKNGQFASQTYASFPIMEVVKDFFKQYKS